MCARARNRFIAATSSEAKQRLDIQSGLLLDAIATVRAFPYVFTNAGVLAEAAAHWAFELHPELRVNDKY